MSKKIIVLKPVFLYAIIKPIVPLLMMIALLFVIYFGVEYFLSLDIVSIDFELTSLLPYAVGVLCIAFLYYVYRVAFILSHKFKITNEQIEYVRGVFSINSDFVELYRVKDLMIKRPFIMRLLTAQNLSLVTSDKSHPILHMFAIPTSNIHEVLRELVELNRNNKGVYEID
tara:strand:+ start:45288 stop:45800 length:513 start_codon:yes stop_codon:yes gene_type:complete